MENKSFQFSADTKALEAAFDRIKSKGQETAQASMRDLGEQVKLREKSILLLDAEIKLTQKKIEVERTAAINANRGRMASGQMGQQQFISSTQDINTQASAAQRNLTSLQGNIEPLVDLEREKRRYEKQVRDEEKQLTQQGKLQDKQDKERDKVENNNNEKRRRVELVTDLIKETRNIVGQSNAMQAGVAAVPVATSLITGNPIVNAFAGLFSAVTSKALESGAKYERSLANISQITGQSQGAYSLSGNTSELQAQRDKVGDTISYLEKGNLGFSYKANVIATSGYKRGMNNKEMQEANIKAQKDADEYYKKNTDANNKLIKSYEETYKNLSKAISTTEKTNSTYIGDFYNQAEAMGLDPSQIEGLRAKQMRSTGEIDPSKSRDSTLSSLRLMKGFGIEEGQALTLDRNLRGGVGSLGAEQSANRMMGSLISRGVISEKDKNNTSMLPEYLQQLVEINKKQLETLGSVNTNTATNTIASYAALAQTKNPDLANIYRQKIEKTFEGESSNPQIKALQYSVMSEMGENNIYEMRKILQNPNSDKFKQYVSKMAGKTLDIAGGNEQIAAGFLSDMSGGGITQEMAEKMTRQFKTQGETFAEASTGKDAYTLDELRLKASENYGTTTTEKKVAEWEAVWQQVGKHALDAARTIDTFLDRITTSTSDIDKDMGKAAADSKTIADNFAKTNGGNISGTNLPTYTKPVTPGTKVVVTK